MFISFQDCLVNIVDKEESDFESMWMSVREEPLSTILGDDDDDDVRVHVAGRSHRSHRSHRKLVRRLDWDCHPCNCPAVCREGLKEIFLI